MDLEAMREYRIYSCDTEGHIIGVKELVAANDKIAEAAAKVLLDGHDLQVWEGKRVVAKLSTVDKNKPKAPK
jgi:hypothetical protein